MAVDHGEEAHASGPDVDGLTICVVAFLIFFDLFRCPVRSRAWRTGLFPDFLLCRAQLQGNTKVRYFNYTFIVYQDVFQLYISVNDVL